ncbi:hypothetical protein [Natranaerobius trueperi]|uniref:hypothetical protein n=1 Tax=Natranaerobius trueperi TaxID=759412 RepID=UPI0026878533
MSMNCFQCQETAKNQGCTKKGICGKTDQLANLQDLLIHITKGISWYADKGREVNIKDEQVDRFVMDSLFTTITNVNFSDQYFIDKIKEALAVRESIKEQVKPKLKESY